MTPAQRLAAVRGSIAEVLIDLLRAEHRSSASGRLRGHWDDDDDTGPGRQWRLPLSEDEEDEPQPSPLRLLPPDRVAAAVLLGRALDANRDLLRRLQDAGTVAVIELPSPDLVDVIEGLLDDFVFGGVLPVIDGDTCKPGDEVAPVGSVVLFSRKDDASKSKLEKADAAFAAAVQRRCAIIGLAADPDRLLPRDLSRLAEYRLVIPPIDAAAVGAVIEAVTGRSPGPIEASLARATTPQALTAAVRGDLGATGSLSRLRRLISPSPKEETGPRLAELHGLGAARDWALDLIKDLRAYRAGRLPWSAVDRGCLLTGRPGTGKTTFARALAREAGTHFVATSYAQWQSHKEGHLGHVTQAIRQCFAEARQHAPAILFIDEIDTMPARGSTQRHDDWWTAIVNTLLEQLEGFEQREGIVVIAACNDPSRLDPALVRAGRLDRHIEIPLPDVPALLGIFRTHLGADDLPGADLLPAVLAARGRTGADVARLVREARRAARKASRAMILPDLVNAVRAGAPEWPAEVRRRVAYHEAGHAIATLVLGLAEPAAISITGSGGLAENMVEEVRVLSRGNLESYLVILLAGRAAEILVFGEPTAGAGGDDHSDLARATGLAVRFETTFGLGELGPLWIGEATSPRDLLILPELRATIRRTIEAAQSTAIDLLTQNRPSLDALAQALDQRGYLDRAEIDHVLATVPPRANSPQSRSNAQASPSSSRETQAPAADVDCTERRVEPPLSDGTP